MATTATKAWPYAGPNDAPDVPYWLQRLAEKGEAVQLALEAAAEDGAEKRRYAEFTMTATVDPAGGAGAQWGTNGYTVDSAKTFNNDFVQQRGTGTSAGLSITKAGVYAITGLYLPGQDPGQFGVGIHVNGSGAPIAHNGRQATYGNWESSVSHAGVYLPAGAYFDLISVSSTGAFFGGRVIIHRTGN